jgi:hypothetical protein
MIHHVLPMIFKTVQEWVEQTHRNGDLELLLNSTSN